MGYIKIMHYRYFVLIVSLVAFFGQVSGQRPLPDELLNNSIEEQINYLEERTRIYENYRAIREDMFQKINSNVLDSLRTYKDEIAGLNNHINVLNGKNDSLVFSLEETETSLQEMTRTKNEISVFGLSFNKTVYNTVTWAVIAALLVLLILGYLVFKRNRSVTVSTKNEIRELKDEFEEYRQKSRLAREKMTMEHFNEVKKLKERMS